MARVMERVSTVNTNDHRRPASTKQRSGSGVGRFTILGSELPGVTGGEISHLRQTFLRRAESAGGERPQQQQPIQRPALGRGDSFKRRMTFVGGGGLGSSTRRLSLDDRTEELTSTQAVSNYQEVFQQLKHENPTVSLGALQQKTMARLAELKMLREQEEEREREALRQREEEDRLRNQNLAKKALGKWVGKMRNTQQQNQLQQQSGGSAALDTSEHSHNLDLSSSGREQRAGDNIFAHLVPTGARPFASSLTRSTMVSNRRISVESSATTGIQSTYSGVQSSSVADNTAGHPPTRGDENNISAYVNAGLVVGGDDQAGNLAPRKSVGDLTADLSNGVEDLLMDDKSIHSMYSLLSDMSGLFIDAESVASGNLQLSDTKSSEDAASRSHNDGEDVSSSRQRRRSRSRSRSRRRSSKSFDGKQQHQLDYGDAGDYDNDNNIQSDPSTDDPLMKSIKDLHDALSATRSVASDFSGDYSSSGLIVGFRNQVDDDENEDGLIVGFVERKSNHSSKCGDGNGQNEEEDFTARR